MNNYTKPLASLLAVTSLAVGAAPAVAAPAPYRHKPVAAMPYRHLPVANVSAKKCYKRIIHRHGAVQKIRVKCPKAATSKATWSSVARVPSGAKW